MQTHRRLRRAAGFVTLCCLVAIPLSFFFSAGLWVRRCWIEPGDVRDRPASLTEFGLTQRAGVIDVWWVHHPTTFAGLRGWGPVTEGWSIHHDFWGRSPTGRFDLDADYYNGPADWHWRGAGMQLVSTKRPRRIAVPLALVLLVAGGALWWSRDPSRRFAAHCCQHCGYDASGVSGDCPECGKSLRTPAAGQDSPGRR